MNYLTNALVIGFGATAFMDAVAAARHRLFDVPFADYGLVGRWLAYMPRGRFRHDAIAASQPVRGERLIGWTAHYLIGVAFATLLLSFQRLSWTCQPTLLPALIIGIGGVAAPFFLMQPGMGAGVAASRTSHPGAARLRSLIAHATFGVGLYVAGSIASWLGVLDCGIA
jgi:Protein of unknown function (DUF2938)